MQRIVTHLLALSSLLPASFITTAARAQAQTYASMAPLDQYLIPDQNAEIALARTGAPASISDRADVIVLAREATSPQ